MKCNRYAVRRKFFAILFAIAGLFWPSVCPAGLTKVRPAVLPVNKPEQITSETDPVLHTAVSRDGKWLVYTAGRQDFTDLWLRSADPNVVVLPRRLTFDPSGESSPVFSPNGRWVAYTGTADDVKGDIYLLDLDSKETGPVRLTKRETEDGGACFSSDGNTLYFHQAAPGDPYRHLAALDLSAKDRTPVRLNIGRDGAFPSVSPDGTKLVFISYREDPAGDIYILNLKNKKISALTSGPYMDWLPKWSPDNRHVYFSRIAVDTDKDGKLTSNDKPSIYRVDIEDIHLRPYPLTPYTFSAFQPQVAMKRLFFLSDRGGVTNCWSIPTEGVIPLEGGVEKQMDLAEILSKKTPPDPSLVLLAYYKVLEQYERVRPYAARAAFEIGNIYQRLEMTVLAGAAFTIVGQNYNDILPEAALALIELRVLETKARLAFETKTSERLRILAQGMAGIDAIAGSKDPEIQARAKIERARLLYLYGQNPDAFLQAANLLDTVIKNYSSERRLVAEAMILKGDVYAKMGISDEIYPVYLAVIKTYPEISPWADEAVSRILKLTMAGIEGRPLEEKIEFLRNFAQTHRRKNPLLTIGALNRVADLLYGAGEWARAKDVYYRILDQFRILNTQTSAARLALAEILYKEERFRQALDLYETEIALRSYEDDISSLVRAGYIRKSIASGEFLYRLGEIPSSRKIFKELMDYDDTIVAAHRGYIKCAAALKTIRPVLDKYKHRLAENPGDFIAMYAAGLCLTYLEDKTSLHDARRLILNAIEINGRIEYFHQTLGYIFEVLETVYRESGMLEMALESYKKAYFLNDHQSNPANAANLSLNLANTYFLLGQYRKAFSYYTRRLEADVPFENQNTAILFYRRLGTSAFRTRETQKAVSAFKKSLELIDRNMQPQQASDAFDRINRFVMDRIVAPGLRQSGVYQQIKTIADAQVDINRRLSELNHGNVLPPPAAQWNPYRRGIEALLAEQRSLNQKMILLLEQQKQSEPSHQTAREILSNLAAKVDQALNFPERLIELKVEMLDRLGLAYQEAGYWQKAADTFEQTFLLNRNLVDQGLGTKENLGRNKRSAAYNAYLRAGTLSGKSRRELLKATAEDFLKVIDLVKTFGVPDPKKQQQKSLVTIRRQVAADKIGASQAGYGFTADQEIRLAETFLSRIDVELGQLPAADKAIAKQLAEYPIDSPVADQDVYGVSLLYHRAGQLAAARGKLAAAFEYFRYSADLSLGMQNPVSTAINVANMAGLLAGIPADTPGAVQFRKQLEILDRQTTKLLAGNPFIDGKALAAGYHNKMGVYFSMVSEQTGDEMKRAVLRVRAQQQAAVHFLSGLKMLDQKQYYRDRENLNLLCALHLNMAKTALDFEDQKSAEAHFNQALKFSRRGVLPELQWRALAGLGRLDEALKQLDGVTILRSGCGPDEIASALGKLVSDLVKQDHAEQAFDLAERLSEHERFNRLAPIISTLQEKGKDPAARLFFRRIYPRLQRIQKLREHIARTEGEEQQYLIESLSRENQLVDASLGRQKQILPDTIRLLRDQQAIETTLILLGLAVHAEETAALLVKAADKDQAAELLNTYNDLIEQYRQTRRQAVAAREAETAADVLTFFGPEPYTAVDVAESLPEDGKLVRLFKTDEKGSAYIVFTVTPGSIDACFETSIPDVVKHLGPLDKGFTYLGYESISRIYQDMPDNAPLAFVLSGSHLVRSIKSRKPFKRFLLAVGSVDQNIDGYDVKVLKQLSDSEIESISAGTNVLLIADRVSLTASVPTKEGEYANLFLAVKNTDSAGGNQAQAKNQAAKKTKDVRQTTRFYSVSVQRLLAKTPNLSLALLPGASIENAYLIGHIFSIYGCAGVILADRPAGGSEFSRRFLRAYISASAQKAMQTAGRQTAGRKWIQIGFKGMTSEESQAFFDRYFTRYVVNGQQAYENNDSDRALFMFENAIQIAQTAAQFEQYLPALYNFGRDSAVMAGRQNEAVEYGRKVVTIMEKTDPGSEQHARALLMLGSVYAQFETYEKAVPHIENAIKIMAKLKLTPDQIEALAGLGVVLANATQYNRALVHLQSAVSLTKGLDQQQLLARHYVGIGGIYDRGLNQYALAVKNYNKALSIYRRTEQTGETARMLLSIGRCYRLMGNFIEAESLYRQALKLVASDPENLHLKAQIIFEQANLAWFRAEYETAFKLQRVCYSLARTHNWPLMQTLSLNTSGLIWWTLGNNQKALDEFEKALSFGRDRMVPDDEIANIFHNTALAYRAMGRYREALDAFDKAIAIDTRLKTRWALAYDLRNKALLFLKTGQPEKAVPLFEKAAAEAGAIGNRINEAKALSGLADALSAGGRGRDAEKEYHRALSLSRSMALRETEWRSLYGLAKLRLKEKKREEAVKLLYEAVQIIESVRADVKIDVLKENFIDNKLAVYETLVRLLADMGRTTESFEMAERSRARNFVDLLGNQRLSLGKTVAQQFYDRQLLIRSQIQEYEALLAQSVEPADRKVYAEALAKLHSDYSDLMLDIQARNPQLSSIVAVQPLKADKLIAAIEKDVALLAYYVLPDEIFCWIVKPQGIALIRTPMDRKALGQEILEYRRMIQNIEPLGSQSRKLFQRLIAPVIDNLTDVKTLGIVPHGPLHYLSFATLAGKQNYLIDDYALFYLPSASVLDYTVRKRIHQKKLNVLAIGNPDLGDPVFDLPFAEHEIDSIHWNFPNITTLTKDKATESWVVKNIEKFDIIHMASHGEFDPVNPLFSSIKLSKGKDTDGNLEAAEIFGLKIKADVVVLSACQTGLGRVTDGDDVIGLNRAFFYAGTHTIVSSLWRVSDIATAVLIKQFYRQYVRHNKADSLRAAVLHVKQRNPHPSYWGAFTLVGDYQ